VTGTPVEEFDYVLPEGAIAQEPVEPRGSARLLVALDPDGGLGHRRVDDLPELLGPGDVLVVNDSRVIPARLHLRKATGARVEVMLLAPVEGAGDAWEALVRPGRRLRPGTLLHLMEERPAGDAGREHGGEAPLGRAVVEVGEPVTDPGGRGHAGDGAAAGVRLVRLLDATLPEHHGEVPLPPYIHRPLEDPERYQTVYARRAVSVAAPTAGLHFTPELLDRCRAAGAEVHAVELAVGLGTFRPITATNVEDHAMHPERYRVPDATIAACRGARRVVAVGTTALRALETVAAGGPSEGETRLYVHGDHPWGLVDVLLTNFHLPRSSLLVLLASFAGRRWRALYEEALGAGYRFLSFCDALLVVRHDGGR
jgi:S-adenosylmethionine:tRNA ribosyltransferase-isomerase